MKYNYSILRGRPGGYALFKWNDEALFWEQCTKWYKYLANLKRFNHEANQPCYYKIIERNEVKGL
nr:MAG TPA: hypothetical protein [Caudoviricetes sp.]